MTALDAGTHIRLLWYDVGVANVPIRRDTGDLMSADASTILLQINGAPRTFHPTHVHRIDTLSSRKDSIADGAPIGAGVGLGIAGVMAAGSREASDPMPPLIPIVLGTAGAAIGGLADAARSRPEVRTVYFNPRPPVRR